MTAAEYVAGLPDCRPEEELRPYLACPSTMAVFELRRDGARQALGVKVIPYRTTPTIYAEPLTAATQRRRFGNVFPVVARKEPFVRYSWGTPPYRQLCAGATTLPDAYAEIAGELERWLGQVFTDGAGASSPAHDTKVAAFDVLDLMRADRPCDPTLVDALRRRWVRVGPGPDAALRRARRAGPLGRAGQYDSEPGWRRGRARPAPHAAAYAARVPRLAVAGPPAVPDDRELKA